MTGPVTERTFACAHNQTVPDFPCEKMSAETGTMTDRQKDGITSAYNLINVIYDKILQSVSLSESSQKQLQHSLKRVKT